MSEILRCEGLIKKYGSFPALKNVNLTVQKGKIVGLLGPNGSGKTTLIKLINGLLTPTDGSLYIEGEKPGVSTKTKVSYLPDEIYLNAWMKVRQIVEYFEDFYSDFRPEVAYEMFEKLNISPNQPLKKLSKGNKEKVCLILAMSRNAKLYVLDEPIAGVDPAARDYVISTILNSYNPDATVLISTHLISDIEPILDEAIFIHNGEILLHKSVEEIKQESNLTVDEYFREVFKW